jgi:hypothetical protein
VARTRLRSRPSNQSKGDKSTDFADARVEPELKYAPLEQRW